MYSFVRVVSSVIVLVLLAHDSVKKNTFDQVIETINQGTYGVVFSVQDVVTKVFGVIKVAKSLANDSGNASAEWEGFILETMFKRVSRSLPLHYFSVIERNEILQTANVEYLQKPSKPFKLISIWVNFKLKLCTSYFCIAENILAKIFENLLSRSSYSNIQGTNFS